jgi:NAD(P)-dependent dehydrogenase (short-subunit alcohol dehydrogenase family)
MSGRIGDTAIVTGSTGLIGAAIAEVLQGQGWNVIGISHTASGAPSATMLAADLSTDDGVAKAEDAIRFAPRLGMLVNNAGVTGARQLPQDVRLADWDRAQAINVRPVVALSVAAVQRWIADGVPGCIVNVSSPGASRAHMHRAVYDATKGAVEAFTRALAVDAGEHGIRVNAVVPAMVVPGFDRSGSGAAAPDLPLGRGASPEQVAHAVAFLASEQAAATTGHALAVDGGLLAQARSANVALRAGSEEAR